MGFALIRKITSWYNPMKLTKWTKTSRSTCTPEQRYKWNEINIGIGNWSMVIKNVCHSGALGLWEFHDTATFAHYTIMMTWSNGNIFEVTSLLCGELTGHRLIPRTKASDAELWCFLWSVPAPTVEQTMETPVFWDAMVLIITSL